jgi:hypothetical protein
MHCRDNTFVIQNPRQQVLWDGSNTTDKIGIYICLEKTAMIRQKFENSKILSKSMSKIEDLAKYIDNENRSTERSLLNFVVLQLHGKT